MPGHDSGRVDDGSAGLKLNCRGRLGGQARRLAKAYENNALAPFGDLS
ncbi:hypothetical protein GGR25_001144 [Kaistia hirudinis]|uniref:Uncharacterized protein n=1 Tax=Kaistia hirudinis TaxID=1293440 RepID=A0A840ANK1_9HYPH|nr:hypothetical protein [Kaistia hirudinis]